MDRHGVVTSNTENLIRAHFGKVVFGALVAAVILVVAMIAVVRSSSHDNAIKSSVAAAEEIVNQYKLLRGYYAEKVVKKAKSSQALQVGIDHDQHTDMIPLPATLIHDLSGADIEGARYSTAFVQRASVPQPKRTSAGRVCARCD